jgi:CBS domain-containing protein
MKKHTVADVMTRAVVSVAATIGYKEIVETLADHSVSAVPVVDDAGRVIGVVSEADLLYKTEYAAQPYPSSRLWERKRVREARGKASADTAGGLMTSPAIVVDASETVGAAARLMDTQAVKRLPVVDGRGRLVGIVSRGDILRLFLRNDADIEREVREDVLLHDLWIDPEDISVEVTNGVVTLGGAVDRHSTIGIVVKLVQRVAGVVDVVSHLSYHLDDRRQHRDAPVRGVA